MKLFISESKWKRGQMMIYIVGNVFEHRLKSDSKEEIFNMFPMALVNALLPYKRDINLYTRFKAQKDLNEISQYLEDHHVLHVQFDDTDDYELMDEDLETMFDGLDYTTVVMFSNIDQYYAVTGSLAETSGCKLIAYVNKPFLDEKNFPYIDYYFIEEDVSLGYIGEIPEQKYTIIPRGMSDNEAAELMSKKVIEIDDALTIARKEAYGY